MYCKRQSILKLFGRMGQVGPICLTIFAICAIGFGSQALAQVEMGSITGTVKDPAGAVVVGANCTLTDTATGVSEKAVSTTAGAYSFPLVKAGTYSLTVNAKGFKEYLLSGIVVHVGSADTEDISLQLGSVSQEVTVTSAAPLLQAQDASLGTTIDSTAATELPLFGGGSGRNFMDLLTIAPGVQYTGSNLNTSTFLVHGVQSGQVDVRLNGSDDNAEVFGGVMIPPIPDSIQEFKLQSGDNSAELGEFYGSVVNVITKRGSNQFHGKAWEYNANDEFGIANDYFNKLHQLVTNSTHSPNRPARYKENSFGGYFSGPVTLPYYRGKNRTFFFADYQRTDYDAANANNNYTVPTSTMQSSKFTNLSDFFTWSKSTKVDGLNRTFQLGTILDPATTRMVACGSVDPVTNLVAACPSGSNPVTLSGVKYAVVRDPYFQNPGAGCPSVNALNFVTTDAGGTVSPGCLNQLPASRLDPNALALLELMPAANQTNSSGSFQNNYNVTKPQPQVTPQWDVRIDHTVSEKDSVFGTYSHYNHTTPGLTQLPGVLEGGSNVSTASRNPTQNVVVTETHVFNAGLINEFRISWEHRNVLNIDPGSIDSTFGIPAQYGIQGIPQISQGGVGNGGLSQFNISNIISFGGHQNNTVQNQGAWGYYDNLTKTVGKHEWKFGAEWLWTYGNISQVPYPKGYFAYTGLYSDVPYSGDSLPAMADYLLTPAPSTVSGGLSTSTNLIGGVQSFQGNSYAFSTYHSPYLAFYAMDGWKITPSLTASLGIRYEYFGPYYSNGGQEANFWMGGDGNEASGSAFYVGHDGCSTTMSPFFKGLLAYDNIPIICEPSNAANEMPKANWAPRLGFAYRIRPNLVARVGAGVAYSPLGSIGYGGTLGTNYPFRFNIQSGSANNPYTPQLIGAAGSATATMESTFANVDITNAANAVLPLGGIALYGKQYHFKIPYVTTLDFALQYQFTNHDSIQATYVGNIGRDLESGDPYHNAPRQALTPSTTVTSGCTASQLAANPYCENSPLMPDGTTTIPFPNLAALAGPMEVANQVSNYQSGELEYQHQFAAGFNMDANYTFVRCWTDAQGGQQNESPSNGRAPWLVGFGGYRADYDRCSNTAANVFHLSGEFGLPFGKGAHWAAKANTLEDALIGGWKLDPIWIASSGYLANIQCQGTNGYGGNSTFNGPWWQASGTAWSCGAPLVAGKNPYGPGPNDHVRTRITGYWNSSALTAPQYAVQSNGSQDFTPFGVRGNQIYGPGWYDVDLSIHKEFKTTEKTRVEVQAQALNAFNHVQLNNPAGGSIGNGVCSGNCYTTPNTESLTAGFGTITGDKFGTAGRIVQFVGKFSF
jgi:carboxypeptidase family protein